MRDHAFVFVHDEPEVGSVRQPKAVGKAGDRIMTARKFLIPKSEMSIRDFSGQRLSDQYAELLRLRRAVREAELLADDCELTCKSSPGIKYHSNGYAN
jgi:hypothetical protein